MLKSKFSVISASTAVIAALAIVVGCGGGGGAINEKFFSESQEKITTLEAKGVPPSELSGAKVFLHSVKENHNKKNGALAKKDADSLRANLALAQKFYDEQVSTLGPKIDAAKATALKAKEELSGYQARKIDSIVAFADSLKKVDRPMQANNAVQDLVARIPSLKEDEQKAAKLRKIVPGTWVYEEKLKSEVVSPKDAAVTRKTFTFKSDGKVEFVESKFGQSSQYLKEDWLFRSWGTYDYKGDTIMLSVSRFKAERQRFEKFKNVGDGKTAWVKEPGPEYDSAITDRSQDRHITYDDLKEDFRRK